MSTKKKKEDTRRYGSFWVYPNCEGKPEFEHADMMKHMQEVHGIDPKTTQGKKTMLMHADAATWFTSQYEWEINGLKFHQSTCTKRSKESQQYWR